METVFNKLFTFIMSYFFLDEKVTKNRDKTMLPPALLQG